MFTTVEEADAREVMEGLADSGHLPPGLSSRLEYVEWCGEYKDLAFVAGANPDEVLLVDDDAGWMRPDQRCRWGPGGGVGQGPDDELDRVRSVLTNWLVKDEGHDAWRAILSVSRGVPLKTGEFPLPFSVKPEIVDVGERIDP